MDAPSAVARVQSAPDPLDASTAASDGATGALLAAIGGVAAILINVALLLGVRRGLPNDLRLIALFAGYGVLVICCSVGIEILITDALRRALTQVLALVAFLLLPVVSRGAVHWLLVLLAVAAAFIAVACARRAMLRAQTSLLVWLGPALCLAVAIALYGIAGFQHAELQNHFLMPEYGRLGLLHKDPFMFASFAAEIMNGYWPGAALDGLRPILYHFGTPLFLASFALTSGSSPLHAYMAGQQILFIPLILFYAGLAASSLARCAGGPLRVGALSAALGIAAVLTVPYLRWPIIYYSESSGASAPLLLMMVPLAATWLASHPGQTSSIGHALVLGAAIVTAAVFKFSAGMMTGILAGYLVLRRLMSQRASDIFALGALALALVLAVLLWPPLFGSEFVIQVLESEGYVPAARLEAVWALACLATTLVLQLACRAAGCELARMRPVLRMLFVLFPFAVVGGWLLGTVDDIFNAGYLFNTLLLFTLPLIALHLAALLNAASLAVEHRMLVLAPVALPATALIVVALTAFAMQQGRAAPSGAAAIIGSALDRMCERAMPEAACRANTPRAFQAAPAALVAAIEAGTGARILAALQRANVTQHDAIFVPPENETYWRFIIDGRRRFHNLNFLPAHLGVPVLLGLPPTAYLTDMRSLTGILLGRYDEGARSRPMNDDELCRHARQRRVARIVVFESLDATRMLDCRGAVP